MKNRSLIQWLAYLENRHPREIRLGTKRVSEVAQKLGVASPDCPVVTVAGTNGKGSTVTALETIYHTAGYTVGAYTSPHLIKFNERIKVNLIPIHDEDLCEAFSLIDVIRGDIELSYFEMATLAALIYFKQKKIDLMILEVGLGGRLDATNIINADLAIITTIDFDHQEYLGNTLNAIGYEKAGILRQKKPFIYADTNPPPSVIETAEELKSPTYLYGKDFSFHEQGDFWDFICSNKVIKQLVKPKIQLKSAAAAIMASTLLQQDLPVPDEAFDLAMRSIFIAGRLELKQSCKKGVSVLYDVSHNPQSVKLLAQTLLNANKAKIHAVFSALKDKDILEMILPLKDCVDHWYLAQLDNKRAATSDYLLSICKKAQILVEICYTDPIIAFEKALNLAESGDLIVVYGSFVTVGQVMAAEHNLEQKGFL